MQPALFWFNRARLNKRWFILASGSLILTLILLACGDETPTDIPAAKVATATLIPPSQTAINTPQPALNSTPAPTQLCQNKDLAIKASWKTNEAYEVEGSITFANQSGAVCKLAGIAQIQVLDEQGQFIPVTQVPADNSISAALLQPGQQVFVALLMRGSCKLFVEPDKGNFTLKVNFQDGLPGSSLSVGKVTGTYQLTGPDGCKKLSLQAGPYEMVAGTAFTATAVTGRQTVVARSNATSTAYTLTEKARPPSPTATIIPTVPAGAKPCKITDLSLDIQPLSGATGWSWSNLYLTNIGSTICTLQGYPELQRIDEKGLVDPDFSYYKIKRSGIPSERTNETTGKLVGVLPGKAAMVLMEAFRCDYGYVPGKRTLKLILPGNQGALVLRTDTQYCSQPIARGISAFDYAPDDWRNYP